MKREWINNRLKVLNKKKAGLARALGLPQPRINDIINKNREIKWPEFRPMCLFLEFEANELMDLLIGKDTEAFPKMKSSTLDTSSLIAILSAVYKAVEGSGISLDTHTICVITVRLYERMAPISEEGQERLEIAAAGAIDGYSAHSNEEI